MSRIHMISTQELRHAIEIIEDLAALADPSEYLKTEVTEVISMLKGLDSISAETYTHLNESKET